MSTIITDPATARRLAASIRRDIAQHGEAGGGEEEGRKLFVARVEASLAHLWSEDAPTLQGVDVVEVPRAAYEAVLALLGRLTAANLVAGEGCGNCGATWDGIGWDHAAGCLALEARLVRAALDFEYPEIQAVALKMLGVATPAPPAPEQLEPSGRAV